MLNELLLPTVLGDLCLEISLNEIPHTPLAETEQPGGGQCTPLTVAYVTKVAYNVPNSLLNRYLQNSESVHARDLLNSHCVHTLQSHTDACTISTTFDFMEPVDGSVNYPLVVLTVEENPLVNDRQMLGSVIGVVSLFHIPNPANSRRAALLFQYLVFMDNHFLPLKRLFTSEDLCAVCQVQR